MTRQSASSRSPLCDRPCFAPRTNLLASLYDVKRRASASSRSSSSSEPSGDSTLMGAKADEQRRWIPSKNTPSSLIMWGSSVNISPAIGYRRETSSGYLANHRRPERHELKSGTHDGRSATFLGYPL